MRNPLRSFFFRHPTMIYEITPRCNQRCAQCYNVWKNGAGYSGDELPATDARKLVQKILRESRCDNFTITGGEPCLREDLEELVALAAEQCQQVTLITNGTLLHRDRIRSLMDAGVSLFEFPLNSGTAELHNKLAFGYFCSDSQPDTYHEPFDAFARVTEAAADIATFNGKVAFVFVATRHNVEQWEEALKLGIALGGRGFLFNRYNAGGECNAAPSDLMPSVQSLKEGLAIASRYVEEYGVGIGASIAMPPCLIRHEDYPGVGFGFCAAGTDRAYYTVSPLGDVRPCNHSLTVLGNLFSQKLCDIVQSAKLREFMAACPDFCRDCSLAGQCLGGCKAAAEACFGDLSAVEPFVEFNRSLAVEGQKSL